MLTTAYTLENYDPYLIFCLQTRLADAINREDAAIVVEPFMFLDERIGTQRVHIRLFQNNIEIVDDEKYQGFVDEITQYRPEYCLVFSWYSLGNRYPKPWLYSILPHLTIPQRYDPIIEDGRVYLNLHNDQDYTEEYVKIIEDISEQLSNYYRNGIVVCLDKDFASRNDLIHHSGKLYRCPYGAEYYYSMMR